MSSPSEYLCTQHCIQQIEDANLPLYALRLVHACHYVVDKNPGLSMLNMAMQPEKQYTVRCQTLLEATGTPRANDFGMIRAGAQVLQGGQIFSHLRLSASGRKLTFRFSKKYATDALRRKKEKFAFVDVDVIRSLRTPQQILFYTRCAMVLGSDFPMFRLPWSNSAQSNWLSCKKPWLSAACRVSEALGLDFVLIPKIDVETDEVFHVDVKIVKKVSSWGRASCFRGMQRAFVVVDNGKSATLSRKELRARRNWRRADRA